MKKLMTGILFTTVVFGSHAQAGWRDYDEHEYQQVDYSWVQRRQDRQHHRIENGIKKGQLTHREAKKLWRQHHKIVELANCSIEGGWLSRREKRKLNRHLDKASDLISRFKHNHRTRYAHHHKHHSGNDDFRGRQQNNFSVSLASGHGEHSDLYFNW